MKTFNIKQLILICLFIISFFLNINKVFSQNNMITEPVQADRLGIKHKTINVDGVKIYYAEAGNLQNPTILLLHGFPSSSYMYRDLMKDLAGKYHLIAPDNPGSGFSEHPSEKMYPYTYTHLSKTIEMLIDSLHLKHMTIYMHGSGGLIGFRIIERRPEIIQGIILQNTNMYVAGFGADLQEIARFAKENNTRDLNKKIDSGLSSDGIKQLYKGYVNDTSKINSDTYELDNYLMQLPGRKNIQRQLIISEVDGAPDYRLWQKQIRKLQPASLVLWGVNDPLYKPSDVKAYQSDLNQAEVHLFSDGHFILDQCHLEAAEYIDQFMIKNNSQQKL